MKPRLLRWAGVTALAASFIGTAFAAAAAPPTSIQFPLSFEPNIGFAPAPVRFVARGPGYALYFSPQGVQLAMPAKEPATLEIRVAGSRPDTAISGVDVQAGKVNYLLGKDSAKWRKGVTTYRQVAYSNVLPGIDLIYYGQDRRLEYDFRVRPGADPKRIRMVLGGGDWKAKLTSKGDLEIAGNGGSVRFTRPVAYQVAADGSRQTVEARYTLERGRHFGFRLGAYDRSRELVIDPTVAYANYLQDTSQNSYSNGIARDPAGNIYIAGYTYYNALPVTLSPIGAEGYSNGFVAKFGPTGSLVYATYLGGGNDQLRGIAVDASGSAYVTGYTYTDNFPTTANAYEPACPIYSSGRTVCDLGNWVPVVAKLDPTGATLLYGTYLSGSNSGSGSGNAIAVNAAGEFFVVGHTNQYPYAWGPPCGTMTYSGFPTTLGAYLPTVSYCDGSTWVTPTAAGFRGFLSKFSASGGLSYSTLIGTTACESPNACGHNGNGSDWTIADGIALDSKGMAYVASYTYVGNYPATYKNTQDKTCFGSSLNPPDILVTKLNPAGGGSSDLVYSSVFGGECYDYSERIAVDQQGNAHVVGYTESSSFPVTPPTFFTTASGGYTANGFITKLDLSGRLLYSSFLTGGTLYSPTWAYDVAVDAAGTAWVAGTTQDISFPQVNPVSPAPYSFNSSSQQPFVVRMKPDGSGALFSTLLVGNGPTYGIAVDNGANAYITGSATWFPAANLNSSYLDPFIAKINGCTGAADLSSQFTVTRGGFRFDHTLNRFVQLVTLTNNGSAVTGLYLALDNLPAGVTLANGSGITTCNSPLGDAFITATAGTVQPSGRVAVTLQFLNPSMGAISYATRVLGGAGAP